MRLLFAHLALLAVSAAGNSYAGIIPNTGATLAATDPNWSVMWRPTGLFGGTSHGALTNAPLVTSTPSPPWQPSVPGVNNWIGVNSSATIDTNGNGVRRYEYAFTTSIDLATDQTVSGAIGYDNFFVGGFIGGSFDTTTGTYIQGTEFLSATSLLGAGNENKAGFCRDSDGFLPASSFPNCTVNFGFNLPAGQYQITFVVQGDGLTDAFLLNQQGVTLSVPEPASLGLVAIGLAGLGFRRTTRKAG